MYLRDQKLGPPFRRPVLFLMAEAQSPATGSAVSAFGACAPFPLSFPFGFANAPSGMKPFSATTGFSFNLKRVVGVTSRLRSSPLSGEFECLTGCLRLLSLCCVMHRPIYCFQVNVDVPPAIAVQRIQSVVQMGPTSWGPALIPYHPDCKCLQRETVRYSL
jgi:hypothetical protein